MTEPNYETHLAELRRTYVESTPRQRLHVAMQRLHNPEREPNTLIAHVSAVEGFARCLVLHSRVTSKEELSAAYLAVQFEGPASLISSYLASQGLAEPETYFTESVWSRFNYAVKYSNLLAHECTYLGQDVSLGLVESCREILTRLAVTRGLYA